MRQMLLPLTIVLAFLICEPLQAQIKLSPKKKRALPKPVSGYVVIIADDPGGGGGGGVSCDAAGGTVSITSSGGNACGNNSTTLSVTGNVGSIQWLSSTDNVSFDPIAGATGSSYTAINLPVSTYFAVQASQSATCYKYSASVEVVISSGSVWYKDMDNDGYSDGSTLTQCDQPTGYKLASELKATSGDCDDTKAAINPETVWYKDLDMDGYSDGTTIVSCTRPNVPIDPNDPFSGFINFVLRTQLHGPALEFDCDDNNPNVFPGAPGSQCFHCPSGNIIYVKQDATGNNDGSSWANAFTSLQTAIFQACPDVTQIWVAKGTYYPDEGGESVNNDRMASFVLRNNLAIYGGFAGTETVLSQRNWKLNETYLSGDIDQNDGSSNINGNSYHVVYNNSNSLDNTAILDGFIIVGGNANYAGNDPSIPKIGGAGLLNISSSPAIVNCTIEGNSAIYNGGGVYNENASPVFTNCIIKQNTSTLNGGGVYNKSNAGSVAISFEGCTIEDNEGAAGAGIFNQIAMLEIINSSFLRNAVSGFGGFANQDGTAKIINSIFSRNIIGVINAPGGVINSAQAGHGHVIVVNCSFSQNQTSINNNGNLEVYNSIADLPITDNTPGGTSHTFTIMYSDGSGLPAGNNNLATNPLFVDPAHDNLMLQAGSPVIDKGSDALYDQFTNVALDLGGNARKSGAIDMGAFESQTIAGSSGILYVKKGSNGTGTSWNNAIGELGDALKTAKILNDATPGSIQQIWVAKGVYKPMYSPADADFGTPSSDARYNSFLLVSGVKLYGGFDPDNGIDDLTDQRILPSSGSAGTTLSGDYSGNDVVTGSGSSLSITNNAENAFHVVLSVGDNSNTILNGFAITGGYGFGGTGTSDLVVKSKSIVAGAGGGMANYGSAVRIEYCRFFGNMVIQGSGGGLLNYAQSNVIINYCHFENNMASRGNGAAIANYTNSKPALTNDLFWGNLGTNGGALSNSTSSPVITNCSFAANFSSGVGATNIANLSFAFPHFTNCILWNSSEEIGDLNSSITTVTYSIVKGATIYSGTGNSNQDPQFTDVANRDLSLLSSSPAINKGNNAAYEASDGNTLNNSLNTDKDLAGHARLLGTTIDMGAYEAEGVPPAFDNCPSGNITANSEVGKCTAKVNLSLTANGVPNPTITYTVNGNTIDPSIFDFPLGNTTVTATASNGFGNNATCVFTVAISDKQLPTVVTKNISVQLDATGHATITDKQVDNGSFDNCTAQTDLVFETNIKSFDCSNISNPVIVTLKVTDGSGNYDTKTATVTVQDLVKPTVVTKNLTIQLDANGQASIAPAQVNNGSTDNCTAAASLQLSLDKTSFDCSNTGSNTVMLTVKDASGNSNSGAATVTVEDKLAPIVVTKNITVQLDANGFASISDNAVDNGSHDNCATAASLIFSTDIKSFNCSNVATPVLVTLTVTDPSGNSSASTATVTVQDKVAPVVKTKNLTVYLSAAGTCSVTSADVNNGSADNCSINTYSLDKTTFNCSNTGPNTVTLTVTDVNGNTATGTAIVTIVDNIPPTVKTKNATIYLDATGKATLTTGQVDNNSFDNCSLQLSLDKTDFDCSNIGANTVTLTGKDGSMNSNSASATVTVVDNTAPIVRTKAITVNLGTNGQVTISAADVDNGSSDNCSIASMSLDKTTFYSSDLSSCQNVFTVNLTVTDGSGNSSSATASVTVKKRMTQLVYNGVTSGQYSDPSNLTATLYDITNGTQVPLANKTVSFTLGNQSIADTYGGSGGGTDANGVAAASLTLNQAPAASYVVAGSFAGDAVYCASSVSTGFTIKPEDICAQYNGQLSVAATVLNKTSNSAKVVMSVGLDEVADGYPGDVTKAVVEFNYNGSWIAVPVQALNTAKTTGNASLIATINFSGDATTLNFAYRVSGFYQVNDVCSDNGESIINVYKPQGEFITGGGTIIPLLSAGVLPSDAGRKSNFGFNVKYTQKSTNLQGNISYLFRRKETDGIVHVYQVKGNSMTSLTVNLNDATEGGARTAVFTGKCNVTDVTNPLVPISVSGTGNSIMQVIITDGGDITTSDKYGIAVWNSNNQLLHSSSWQSTKTTKLPLSGGNVVISGSTSTATATAPDLRNGFERSKKLLDVQLEVLVLGNPSSTTFSMIVKTGTVERISMSITDGNGRVIEAKDALTVGQTITIGSAYAQGTYFAEFVQGHQRKVVKLIKL